MKKPFAKRSLGQNFLSDPNYVNKIISALAPASGETIIEIGPGRGALTERLAASGADIIAIELDRDLVPFLREKFQENKNIHIVEADVLETDIAELLDDPKFKILDFRSERSGPITAKLVANLPYYISTAILQKLAGQRHLFSELVLMFQREVVERITAEPGSSERGFLTVLAEAAFEIERLTDVPPTAFRPQPKIWSSVVRLRPKPVSGVDEAAFMRLVSTGFNQKRKTILNNLKALYPNVSEMLETAGIDPKRRAETLTIEEWISLLGRDIEDK